jgi:hypothetical protein
LRASKDAPHTEGDRLHFLANCPRSVVRVKVQHSQLFEAKSGFQIAHSAAFLFAFGLTGSWSLFFK